MKMRYTCVIAAIVGVALMSEVRLHAKPPKPPKGYRWASNESFTDEFNGDRLNATKWYDYHPRWKGRPPAKFVPDTVKVLNGHLQIKNCVLEPAQGPFNIAGGAVVSKSKEAYYGYYEVRMKASGISMSSTFWFSNESVNINGKRISQELDVQEAVGGGKRHPDRRHYMKSNSHYWLRDGNEKHDAAVPGEARITPAVDEDFHVYGVWWVDAKTFHFYHNDVYKFTINASTRYDDTPFDRPMHMNLVTETYNWETPPTPTELADDSKNTTYYDWVRSFRLESVEESEK